jgi:hypothetical protein
MVVAAFCTVHLLSPLGTMVKQVAAAWPQAVQNPLAFIFHVPALFVPDRSSGSRVILPSGVKIIVNLVPEGLVAVKGWPVKNVDRISAGAIGSAAQALRAPKSIATKINRVNRNTRPGL